MLIVVLVILMTIVHSTKSVNNSSDHEIQVQEGTAQPKLYCSFAVGELAQLTPFEEREHTLADAEAEPMQQTGKYSPLLKSVG